MEMITTNAVNDQEEMEDWLEKVVQDFNEFQEVMSQSSTTTAMSFEELVDLYIGHGGESFHGKSGAIQEQFTALIQDFNEFETMLPASEGKSADKPCRSSSNIDRETQESEMMIKEMTEATSEYAAGTFQVLSQTSKINFHARKGSSNEVIYIRYGDLNCSGAASCGGIDILLGGLLGPALRNFTTASGGGMDAWQKVGVNGNSKQSITATNRIKRKYKKL